MPPGWAPGRSAAAAAAAGLFHASRGVAAHVLWAAVQCAAVAAAVWGKGHPHAVALSWALYAAWDLSAGQALRLAIRTRQPSQCGQLCIEMG
eukprot:gene44415-38582_t